MRLVPESKFDLEACSNLEKASDTQILPYLNEILEWTEDYNWPVAPPIYRRLSKMGLDLVGPLQSILKSNDICWKYFIIFFLLQDLKKEVLNSLKTELIRIAQSPDEDEKEAEMDIEVKRLLEKSSYT